MTALELESSFCLTIGGYGFITLNAAKNTNITCALSSPDRWSLLGRPWFCSWSVSAAAAAAEPDTWRWALCSIRELNFTASLLLTSVFQLASCLKPVFFFLFLVEVKCRLCGETQIRPSKNSYTEFDLNLHTKMTLDVCVVFSLFI